MTSLFISEPQFYSFILRVCMSLTLTCSFDLGAVSWRLPPSSSLLCVVLFLFAVLLNSFFASPHSARVAVGEPARRSSQPELSGSIARARPALKYVLAVSRPTPALHKQLKVIGYNMWMEKVQIMVNISTWKRSDSLKDTWSKFDCIINFLSSRCK